MLNITFEYRKGILFIRLDGKLINAKKTEDELLNMIKLDNLNYLVLNMTSLFEIDISGLNLLNHLNKYCIQNNGNLYICGLNKNIKSILAKNKVLDDIKEIDTELDSFGGII